MVVRAVSSSSRPEPEPLTVYRPPAPAPAWPGSPPRSSPGWTWLGIAVVVMTRTLGEAGEGARQTPGQRSRRSIQSSHRF